MSQHFPLIQNKVLKPAIKVLTDYPRDDLASDEVYQAMIVACAKENVECFACDVGAIPAMDTVVATFKTAQLALNSQLGYGHVFLTNCAPRKNIISAKSKGEGVVIGILPNGVTLLTVNSGYALAPFVKMIKEGKAHFFESCIPDEGSQFRSRDFFPLAAAQLASFLCKRLHELGEQAIMEMLKHDQLPRILEGFSLLGDAIDVDSVSEMPSGCAWYVDNFGNVKLNILHDDLLRTYDSGSNLVVAVGGSIADAIVGSAGFSQGEGILALTCGSSGWDDGTGKVVRFTEVFLRGGSAANLLSDVSAGEQFYIMSKEDLKSAQGVLRDSGVQYIGSHNLFMMSEAKLIQMFAHYGLIRNGYDSRVLRKRLKDNSLVSFLQEHVSRQDVA